MPHPFAYRDMQRETFLRVLGETGSVKAAIEAANVSSPGIYYVRKHNAEFAKRWDEALRESYDRLEAEAIRRGVEGVRRPLYHAGQPIYLYRDVIDPETGLPERYEDGSIKREVMRDEKGQPMQAVEYLYSDAMLAHLLKANIAKFRDRTEITGADGGPLQVEMTDVERARRIAFTLARGLHAAANKLTQPPGPAAPPEDNDDLI